MFQTDAQTMRQPAAVTSLLRWAELLLFFICSLILTGAPVDFLVKTAGIAPTQGLGMFWIPLLVMAGVGLVFHPFKILSAAWVALPVVLLAGVIAASAWWSVDRAQSVQQALFFFASIASAFYVAKRFSLREILNLMALLFAGLALVSIVLALFMPRIGMMQDIHVGAWSGVWIDKNSLGQFYVLGFSIALGRLAENPHSWLTSLPLALLSIGLVLLSTSKTSLVGLILVLALGLGVFFLRRGPVFAMIFGWIATMLAVGAMAILIFAPGLVFDLLQRDATLTSRTKIWAATERLIEQRPVKGYGFGAVWGQTSASAPVVMVHQNLGFKPVNAHSSWMDARLEIGVPGAAALALMMMFGLGMALWSIPWSRSAYWTVPGLAVLLQTSFVESVLIDSHGTGSFLFILFTVLAASSGRNKRVAPRRQTTAPVQAQNWQMPHHIAVPVPASLLSQRLYNISHPARPY
ncbi:hypothetical protein MNBD_ALPHA06-1514 [hydrothermal vent metagenome]|uniref:O-antigen ligase-related domain-containing protein n=1 Tax=hydrothermal vent metagenome TaxID=652676 RepID=A0A3B0RFY9_9ZZZZ